MKILDCLSAQESRSYQEKVELLKSLWQPRGSDPLHPYFHTLGNPLYLSLPNLEFYFKYAKENNETLLSSFKALYQRVTEILQNELSESVKLLSNLAYPGFHIYKTNMPSGGSIHFDLQSEILRQISKSTWDDQKFYSFTLPLQLPKAGTGLNMWPVSYEPGKSKGPFSKDEVARLFGEPEFISYEVGRLYFFESKWLHQIAPHPRMDEGDARITLQGHLIRHVTGPWIIYW